MKLTIDISDSTYEAIMARDWKNAGWLFSEELKAIHNGTPIPENATNGDMIKALFKNCVKDDDFEGAVITVINGEAQYWKKDWWNAPYKAREGKE